MLLLLYCCAVVMRPRVVVERHVFRRGRRYVVDPDSRQLVSERDGHALLEMLARDVMFYCRGYPTF